MKKRQYKKLLDRKLNFFIDHERIKVYTYRGVDENGYLVVLGFTCKPKQEGCKSYGIKYIAEMLHFHRSGTYRMLSPINTKYATKHYKKL
jgi:hypothetical protein